MQTNQPIVIIEDDPEDQDLLRDVFTELGIVNPLVFFNKCEDVIPFLYETVEPVFLILSDVNIPGMDGLALRRKIDADPVLKRKSTPYVFYSTSATKQCVEEAYDMMVQGYFEKPADYNDIKSTISMIVSYWAQCMHPNKF